MSALKSFARRTFLLSSIAVAGGVAFGYYKYKQPFSNPLFEDLPTGASALTLYVRIDSKGVTIIAPRAEMGQGISTTLAALVAEELDVAWEKVHVEHGPASAAYYNAAALREGTPFAAYDKSKTAELMRDGMGVFAKFLGMQITGGSSSIPDAFMKMRQAGAAARFALLAAAAAKLKLPLADLKIEDGAVIAPNGQRLSYAELAVAAAEVKLPELEQIVLKPRSQWRYLGKSMPRVDMLSKVTGTAQFGIDVHHPEMLFATVRMNPAFNAALKSYDASAAKAMRGVVQIVELPGGIGVIANNTWRAFQAAQAVRCEWLPAAHLATTQALFDEMAGSFTKERQDSESHNSGDVDKALVDKDTKIIEAQYKAPYLAHATMEPMTATAWLRQDRLDIWSGLQGPTLTRSLAAKIAGLDESKVHVHVTMLGGGFGRRAESDFALQAVRLAMAAKGKPVKLTWQREEDMTHDMYRPGALAKFRGALRNGKIDVLEAKVASPSIVQSMGLRTGLSIPGPDKGIIEGLDQPYDISHYRATSYRAPMQIPITYWRSVGSSFNGFFIESFIDELVVSANIDPLQARLSLISHPPSRGVLEAIEKLCDWKTPLAKGRGRGIAFHHSFGVPVAQVIEITVTEGRVKVDKVYAVADVGIALDPRNIEAQLQSSIIFGLSAAIAGEITFANGAAEQTNFHQYEFLRLPQTPQIIVKILENNEDIRGIGEPGVPPIAPALANAIFNATGKRIRELPLRKQIDFI